MIQILVRGGEKRGRFELNVRLRGEFLWRGYENMIWRKGEKDY